MLPKKHRLTKREDFSLVYAKGAYSSLDGISIKYRKNTLAETRIGFSVGKNYSKKASDRNRAKRVLRVACSANLPSLLSGVDIVVMLKNDRKPTAKEFTLTIGKLFRKAGLAK